MSRRLLVVVLAGGLLAFGVGGGAAYLYHTRWKPAPASPPPAPPARPAAEGPAPAERAAGPAPASLPPAPTVAATPPPAAPPVREPDPPAPRAGGPAGPPAEVRHLVRLYEGMPPKEAATVLSELDPELSTTILLGMRERQAAKILAFLDPKRAALLTTRIARQRHEGQP